MADPSFESLFNSALQYHRTGNLAAAVALYRQAATVRPDAVPVHNNLSLVYKELGDAAASLAAAQTAVRLAPDRPGLWTNLGNLYRDLQNLDAAIDAYHHTLSLDAGNVPALNNLGITLQDCGQVEDAITVFRRAVEIDPSAVMAHSGLLAAMHYDPRFSAQEILAEHKRWAERHADPLTAAAPAHTDERNPDRPLRVGYVSANLYDHVVGRFMLPLLEHHDSKDVHVFCYADEPGQPDSVSEKLRAASHVWRNIRGLSDEQLAATVRADKIDLLVDLTMHMSGSPLLAFARKPAPVQRTYLAYASTTGMRAMDYRLTDSRIDPPGTDGDYTERSIRLPDCWWCYRPPDSAGEVNPLPARGKNVITFSSLNTFAKVTPQVLGTWAAILRAVPRSRLLLHAREGSHRRRVLDLFARQQVHPDRINFVGFVPLPRYFDLYRLTDIGLDPFPYAGGTTTADALWTGVPVVTLRGNTAVGRGGASILQTIGVPELIAESPGQYVSVATSLANDLPRLAALRASLRPRMNASPLTDAPRFAANVETAYRGMWRSWCSSSA